MRVGLKKTASIAVRIFMYLSIYLSAGSGWRGGSAEGSQPGVHQQGEHCGCRHQRVRGPPPHVLSGSVYRGPGAKEGGCPTQDSERNVESQVYLLVER